MRPHLVAQQAIVRMLFDPGFAARVRRDPAEALPDLPSTLRAQVAAIDARALKLDRLLGRRVLRALFDELKASTTLYLARSRKLASLDGFFAAPVFHDAIARARPLVLAYADFIDALPIERALCEARRMRPPRPDGRIHRAPGVVPIATTQGALATLQQCEQYLFEVGMMPAVALCDPTVLTCAGNDFGFDSIFSRQVEALGKSGDVLICFSTSGNSANILRALETARKNSLITAGFLGRDGGQAKLLCDIPLIVPAAAPHRVQEGHKILYHTLCEWVDAKCTK